ncbi:alpha/beta hydrolase family protein [Candidatus Aenigmatarchaeota archaeon]
MSQEKIFIENHGQKLAAVMHVPVDPTKVGIILVHGFTSSKREEAGDKYARLADALCNKGFLVLRFDFRGHGESEGLFEDTSLSSESSDLNKMISFLKENGIEKIGVVGCSLGGFVTLLTYHNNMDCVVLWYPAIFLKESDIFKEMKSREKELEKDGKLFARQLEGKKYYIGKQMWEEWNSIDVFSKVKDVKCPILFLTGNKDVNVDPSQSEKAFAVASEPKRLEIIDGAAHAWRDEDWNLVEGYFLHATKLTVDWFVEWLKP